MKNSPRNTTPLYIKTSMCLKGVEPLLFSQLCIYYYADKAPAVINEILTEEWPSLH